MVRVAVLIGVVMVACVARSEEGPEVPVTVLEEEIIQITTRLPRDLGTTGATVDLVSAEDIEARQIVRAVEAIRGVPGVFPRAGVPGSGTSVFLRGAASNQTVVLLDGVQINDPTIGGQANFFDLGLTNLERVEVLRGAASALYGSDAAGGVVNLVPARGKGDPTFRLLGEGGSFGHYRFGARGSGRLGMVDFSGALARNRFHNDLPNQSFLSDTYSLGLGVEPSETIRISGRFRYIDAEAEDPWEFPFGAQIEKDPNTSRQRNAILWWLGFEHELSDLLSWSLEGSLFRTNALFLNEGDGPGDPIEFRARSEADVRNLTLITRWDPPTILRDTVVRFLLGGELEDELSESRVATSFGPSPDIERSVRNRAGFFLAEAEAFDSLVLTAGIRRDRTSSFGWETTFSGSAVVTLDETDTQLRVNYGEAFRAPKPVEFDDPFFGNRDLGPEESVHIDLGVEQELFEEAFIAGATLFRVRTSDLIAYDTGTGRLENLSRARTRGVELTAAAEPLDGLLVRAWLTLQDPKKLSAGPGEERRLPGRPKRYGGGEVRYEGEGWRAGVEVHASSDYPGTGKITPDGTHRDHPGRKLLIHVKAAYEVVASVWLTARVENLLDAEWYDDETAPNGLGRGFYVGLKFDFP